MAAGLGVNLGRVTERGSRRKGHGADPSSSFAGRDGWRGRVVSACVEFHWEHGPEGLAMAGQAEATKHAQGAPYRGVVAQEPVHHGDPLRPAGAGHREGEAQNAMGRSTAPSRAAMVAGRQSRKSFGNGTPEGLLCVARPLFALGAPARQGKDDGARHQGHRAGPPATVADVLLPCVAGEHQRTPGGLQRLLAPAQAALHCGQGGPSDRSADGAPAGAPGPPAPESALGVCEGTFGSLGPGLEAIDAGDQGVVSRLGDPAGGPETAHHQGAQRRDDPAHRRTSCRVGQGQTARRCVRVMDIRTSPIVQRFVCGRQAERWMRLTWR